MSTYDVVSAVLAFVRVNGPIGAVAWLMGALAATLIAFFLSAKAAARLSVRKTFDIGGNFDHFYSRALPAARSGAVALIFAGYVGLWLSRWPAASPQFRLLHQPYNSSFYGVLATLIVVGLIAKGTWELAKAEWNRWPRQAPSGRGGSLDTVALTPCHTKISRCIFYRAGDAPFRQQRKEASCRIRKVAIRRGMSGHLSIRMSCWFTSSIASALCKKTMSSITA